MKSIAQVFSAFFKPALPLNSTFISPESSEPQKGITEVEYGQLRDITQARDLATEKALFTYADDLAQLSAALHQIEQQFDAAVLRVLHVHTEPTAE